MNNKVKAKNAIVLGDMQKDLAETRFPIFQLLLFLSVFLVNFHLVIWALTQSAEYVTS
jgi:hypothetical protein